MKKILLSLTAILASILILSFIKKAQAAYGVHMWVSCTLDHTSVCMKWQSTSIVTDKKHPRLKATVTAADENSKCLKGSINVTIDGQSVYTSPLLEGGSVVKHVDLGTYSPGSHRVEVGEASYDGSSCPNPAQTGPYFKYSISVDISPTYPAPELSVPNGSVVRIGDRVSFSGRGWKSKGAPIKVMWGRQMVKRFPASKNFRGSFKLWDFPTKSLSTCAGTLSAVQGAVSDSLALTGTPDRYVYYSAGISRGDGKRIPNGDILCAGAEPRKDRQHTFVWKRGLTRTNIPGVVIDDTISGVQAKAVFFGPSGSISLARGGGKSLSVTANPSIGPDLITNLPVFDPSSQLQGVVVDITPPSLSSVTIDAFTRSGHDLLIDGDLTMNHGYLFVAGNLTVTGSVTGTGALVAAGNLTLKGNVNLDPSPNGNLDAAGSFTMLSGGQLLLGR